MDSFNNSKVPYSPELRIRDPVLFWPRDPGCGMGQNLDPGSRSRINISGHILESVVTTFWIKIHKFFVSSVLRIQDPVWKNQGSIFWSKTDIYPPPPWKSIFFPPKTACSIADHKIAQIIVFRKNRYWKLPNSIFSFTGIVYLYSLENKYRSQASEHCKPSDCWFFQEAKECCQ